MEGQPSLDALLAWLRAYAPADAREAGFHGDMLALGAASAPLARSHFVPGHFTASAFVLSPAEDALLLIHHAKLGIWVQPGGHFEPTDADALAAARREVLEEVGLDHLRLLGPSAAAGGASPLFDLDVHPIPARRDEPAHRHFDVRFAFVAPTLAFTASDEVRAARWVPLGRLDELTTDESVRRAARKLRP